MATRVVGTNIARGGTAGRARTEELCHVDRLQAYLAVGKRLLRCLHFIRFHVTRSSGKIYLCNSDIGIQLRTEWNSHLWKDLIRWSTYAGVRSGFVLFKWPHPEQYKRTNTSNNMFNKGQILLIFWYFVDKHHYCQIILCSVLKNRSLFTMEIILFCIFNNLTL